MSEAIATVGDNRPPEALPQGDAITAKLQAAHAEKLKRRDELLAAEARLPDLPLDQDAPDAAKAVTEYIREINELTKVSEKCRVGEKEPYLSGERRVDGFFKGITDPLDVPKGKALKQRVERKLTQYNDGVEKRERDRRAEELRLARAAEDARIKAEQDALARAAAAEAANKPTQADQALNEAVEASQGAAAASVARVEAERAVAAPAADLTRVRSDYGAVGSLQRFLDFKTPDREMLDLSKLRDHFTDDAFDKAVRSYMRANADAIRASLSGGVKHELRGVEFFVNSRTNVR